MRNEHIVVLMGGTSSEREISLISGNAVTQALQQRFQKVTAVDLTQDPLPDLRPLSPDAVFIALHGKGGEDGTVQEALEAQGIAYTGPGVEASRLCIDKVKTKIRLKEHGIPTPAFFCVTDGEKAEETAKKAYQELGLPLVLKASCQGSSIGTVIVRTEEEILPTLHELLAFGDSVLLEAFLSGTEITVPILGNDNPQVLPLIEILSEGEFYDFHSKYTPGKSHHIIPARLEEKTAKQAAEYALSSYLACGCRGLSRVDLILDEKGNPFVIEINTIPGMTGTSLFPEAAEKCGISFPDLTERLIDLALEEKPSPPTA